MGLLDLFRKKTQSEIFRDEIERTYKNAVMTAIKQCGGNELIAGVLVKSAIASTYGMLKRDKNLLSASGLTNIEYELLMENICKKMLDTYLKSY